MKIHFWGVRGSLPAPLTPVQVQSKISAAVQRITAADIKDSESRERFLANLPEWIFGTAGGNSPCVEVISSQNKHVILDAGTGLRLLAKNSSLPPDMHYDMLFSHIHWDHIQGFPYFDFAYNPRVSLDIYSPFENLSEKLSEQMKSPYYPVTIESMTRKMKFHTVSADTVFSAGGMDAVCYRMNHPGGSYAYALCENDRKFVYATDTEIDSSNFEAGTAEKTVFENADVLVLDSQYTVEDAFTKQHWGHTAFCYAVDFAAAWHVKKLFLFHHDPAYDDRKLNSILDSARWYASYSGHKDLEVYLATEGTEIVL